MLTDRSNPHTRILVVANETAASRTLHAAIGPELEDEAHTSCSSRRP